MRVITWNVNSYNIRKPQVESLLKEKEPDFLLLQETKVEFIAPEGFQKRGYYLYHAGGKGRNGVAIISKYPLEELKIGFQGLDEDDQQAKERILGGRYKDLWIFSLYVPNGSPVNSDYFYYKIQFLYKLRELLEKFFTPQEKIILGGDFNVAPEPEDVFDPLLLEGQICFHERERKVLKYLMEWGLYDALRVLYPHKRGIFTWWDYQFSSFKRNLGMRLDHLLITNPLKQILKEVVVDIKIRALPKPSDHAPVIADFEDRTDIEERIN
ncbi:MAG: exodeoxyribonuclease III [Caldimicrobium sp.]|nr:exodeoxyribonuclease III [Caldimicrobium sp.]MCX7873583.1 exodeoxyribonuclease III [Caldimicrobium sp.]MDW8094032.1 exodeoxyribonuclease III [Caldimicrobium sp.]